MRVERPGRRDHAATPSRLSRMDAQVHQSGILSIQTTILRNAIACALLALVLPATWTWFRMPPPQAPWTDREQETLLSLWIGNLPPPPPSRSNAVADDPRAQHLGHRLFFDFRLSANDQVSCATCHQPARHFTDGVALAQGLAVGELNTMSLVGVAYSPWFFWDGRKDSLWSQALNPLESPIEQGIDRVAVARLIAADPLYRHRYEALFGPLANPIDGDSAPGIFVNVGKAIAAYQRLLLPGETSFDHYVEAVAATDPATSGNSSRLPLNRRQSEGLRLFIGKAQCLNCHNGPLLTNFEFHNTGVLPAPGKLPDPGRVAGVELVRNDMFNCLGPYSDAEESADCAELRFMRTGADLIGARKTPSLRNLGGTAPFMHAGQMRTMAEVLDHYNRARPAIVGHNEAKSLHLLPYELRRLEAFLTTLDAPVRTARKWLVPPTSELELSLSLRR